MPSIEMGAPASEQLPMAIAGREASPEAAITPSPDTPVAPEPVAAPVSALETAENVREELQSANPVMTDAEDLRQPALKLDWASDLIQIETHPEKLRAALAAMQQETPTIRPKRSRPVLEPVSTEPLVQVETRRQENGIQPMPIPAGGTGGQESMPTSSLH